MSRADRLAGLFAPATVVLFAGLGGSCIGIEQAYVDGGYCDKYVDLCVNHWDVAVRVHELNHPMTQHLHADVWEVDPDNVLRGRHIAYLHMSPDCTDFSKAKGGMPKRKHIRALADVGLVWARKRRPDVITLENVEEFQQWGPLMQKPVGRRWAWIRRKAGTDKPVVTIPGPRLDLPAAGAFIEEWESTGWSVEPYLVADPARRGEEFRRWKSEFEQLGYVAEFKEIRACDLGTPTTRKRLYGVLRCDGKRIVWPENTHGATGNRGSGRGTAGTGSDGEARQGDFLSRHTGDRQRNERRTVSGRRSVGLSGESRQVAGEPPLKPYAPAAQCIDWGQPMLSIFATRKEARQWAKAVNAGRPSTMEIKARRWAKAHGIPRVPRPFHDRVGVPQRPLKLKTNQRLAGGLLKHTLESADPFILNIENYGWNAATRSVDEPLSTVTANPKGGKHAVVDVETAAFTGIFNHGGTGSRAHDPRDPMTTVTGARDARGVVGVDLAAFSVPRYGERDGQAPRSQSLKSPAAAVTGTGNGTNLVAVSFSKHYTGVIGQEAGEPIGAITGIDHHSVLAAHVVRVAHGDESANGSKRWGNSSHDMSEPLPTVSGSKDFALSAIDVAPMTLGAGGPAYAGKPRRADLPANSITAGSRQAIAAAHLMKFRGESPGTGAGDPVDTVTAAGHGMGAAVAYLTHMYTSNTCGGEGDPRKPAKTITSGGQHAAATLIYFAPYYGNSKEGASAGGPMPTVVSKDRLAMASVEATPPEIGPHWVFTEKGLARAKQVAAWAIKHLGKKVEKHLLWVVDAERPGKKFALLMLSLKGADCSPQVHIVTDIAMRMLRPRELARAQGFDDSYVIDRTVDGKWVKKADQVKLIGNSVCPPVMRAIAYDNVVAQGLLDERPVAVGVGA